MGTPGSTPDVTREEVRRFFARLDRPSTPVTAATVAEELDCPLRTAQRVLEALAGRDELESTEIETGTRVWWRPDGESGRTEFRAFVSAVEDYAIFVLDPDGTVASWNDGAERIKGYAEDEIVGEHFSAFYTDDDADDGVPEKNLDAAAAAGRVEDEGWRVRKDGTRFWANVTITAIRDDDGALRGFTKVTRDMSERREYEQKLRRERDLTEQIFETTPVRIGVFDAEGRLVRANRRMLDHHGIDASDLPDFPLASIDGYDADGEPISADEWPWRRVAETGTQVSGFECQVDADDGDRRWLSINAVPLDAEAGGADRVVAAVEDVTEQKERERRLEQQKTDLETELSDILGRISDAFYALDDEWRFTHLNDRAADIMERCSQEVLGRKIWEVLPDATGVYRAPFRRAMETQEPVTFETYSEGADAWLEFNVYPSESGLSIYFRDVTDRKERERTLSKYEAIVETVDDGIYVKDDDGYFTMVNEAYADLTGYDREELVGAHSSLVVDEATIDRADEQTRRAADGEEADTTVEAMIRTADGDRVPAEATFAAIETADRTEQIGVVRDISDRREYQRKIEESERRYRTLAENFPNGAVALFDENLRYTAAGGQLLKREGVDPEERIGQSIFDIYPDDLLAEVEPYFHAALDGERDSFEVEYAGRQLSNYILPVGDGDDGTDAGMLVVQDVTERREYQRQLERSNERLEQFAYAASHDLQEPLRMVSSYLQLVERRYADALDDDGREFIDFAVDGADRMRDMIEGLLQYSRVETRGDAFEPTDLSAVLSDVCDDLQIQIDESDAEITLESLPRVRGDSNQLRQVFQNLLDNAIEYSGDEPPRIRVSAEREGAYWRVSVSDEGIGIDPADEERVFDVFQRLHNHDEHSGAGIGLALCQRIVERHGGDIWVDSDPGEGTTFSLTLPAADETAE
ncbi:PAS domain S-box-containing protein [Halopelagius inordinatus]|uniref:histidine kinase n=1 Tax=Halopelagius inordinatus TaxID=553467 RepID=A0A1I2MWP4_9EURY|nr:PAS domain S-box protein [Halopelagius inordinatus]SFF93551.1 PAS domain S-box-containing protein [Halopelagius inordinatus]